MFKKGFFYIAIFLMTLTGAGCSSSSDSGEDLDISEIKEIEATGEFSEDEFFSANSEGEVLEEKLVDEVPDLDAELGEDSLEVAENGVDDELKLEESFDDTEVAKLEGSDVLETGAEELEEDIGDIAGKDVTITADDLGFEEGDEDLFGEEPAAGETTTADVDELDLENEEDLFRDELDLDEPTDVNVAENESPAADELSEDEDLSFADADIEVNTDEFAEEQPASQTVAEDVSIDVDYSGQVANDKSASQLLAEDDVAIDIDYSSEVGQALNTSTPVASNKGFLPVRKMQTVPYSKNGVLVNSIYFVRPGDSLASIGSKIYGNGSAVDFTLVNPHLKAGSLKVGQKVYYNSPNRSQDRSRLLTYYEDVRMPAQTYSASKGENIRTVAKNLLGHPRSWMEIWASNQQIQEKWALSAPHQIRYWNGSQAPLAPSLARNTQPAPAAPKPVAKIEPAAKAAETVAANTSSQASLNLDEAIEDDETLEEDIFDDPVAVAEAEDNIDEPDMELDEPAEVADLDDFPAEEVDEPASEIENTPAAQVAQVDEVVDEPGQPGAAVAGVDGRGIARNQGGFPAKTGGLMGSNMMRQGIIGVSLLLLLVVGFLVVRRRRESQEAIEMESFDFGGETSIEDVQEKTQIDL